MYFSSRQYTVALIVGIFLVLLFSIFLYKNYSQNTEILSNEIQNSENIIIATSTIISVTPPSSSRIFEITQNTNTETINTPSPVSTTYTTPVQSPSTESPDYTPPTEIQETPEQRALRIYANNSGSILRDLYEIVFDNQNVLLSFATTTPPTNLSLQTVIDAHTSAIQRLQAVQAPGIVLSLHSSILSHTTIIRDTLIQIQNEQTSAWQTYNTSVQKVIESIIEIAKILRTQKIGLKIEDPGYIYLDLTTE